MNYLVYGSEPNLVKKFITELLVKLNIDKTDGLSYLRSDKFDKEEVAYCYQISLFSEYKLIVCNSKLDNPVLLKYLENPEDSTTLVLLPSETIDGKVKQSKKYKAITQSMTVKEFTKLSRKDLKDYVLANSSLTGELVDFFINESGYLYDTSINLLSIDNQLKKVNALEEISKDVLRDIMGREDVTNMWTICSYIEDGNFAEFQRKFANIPAKDTIGVASGIVKELRKAIRNKRGLAKEDSKFNAYSLDKCEYLHDYILYCISAIQEGNMRDIDAHNYICGEIISTLL